MIEIMIDLQGGAKAPLYEKIYEHIKREIISGKIFHGEKLPSTRLLAKNLMVSRSTVEMAYDQLLAEGYIKAEPCRGFFVCDITELYQLGMEQFSGSENAGARTQVRADERTERGLYGKNSHQAYIEQEAVIDFSPYAIDTEHFPYNIWRKIHKNVLMDDREELLLSGDGQGDYGLRSAIATYLHRARGVNCRPEDMIIGAGNEYLELLLTQILGAGKKVLMENPTYPQAYRTFLNAGYEVETVPAGEGGLLREQVSQKNPDIIYMMPSHQFPMGTVMPLRQRLELLRWASEADNRYLIEDDHDSEYRYRGKSIPSLQGEDSFGKVIYLGTFSKSIAPSLRISYMVLPPSLLEGYRKNCGFYSTTVPKVQQEVLKCFIEEGYFERHLNKMRCVYRGKHDFLLNELKKRTWVKKVSGEHAGLHVLVEVKSGLAEQEICSRVREKGVRVYGISEYLTTEKPYTDVNIGENVILLLGYGKLTEEEMVKGLTVLDEILGTF